MPALVAMRFLVPTCRALPLSRLRGTEPAPRPLSRLRETEPAPRDRNRCVHLYDQLEPSPDPRDLLSEIDRGPIALFCG